MKKILIFALLALGVCGTAFAKDKEVTDRANERLVKKQKLFETQHGHHFGATLSSNVIDGVNGSGQVGGNLFYGYRLSKHWMLGGSIGVDGLTVGEVEYFKTGKMIERPIISVPIMAEARFYFGVSRVMPYLYANLGAAVSKYTGVIFNTGIGMDINLKDSHTIFVSVGLGATSVPGVNTLSDYLSFDFGDSYDYEETVPALKAIPSFVSSFRLGYYF